jgi:NhaA family Na+:H+ antiporter
LLKHRIRRSAVTISSKVSGLISLLLRDEAISGKFLLAAAVIAIVVANSPLWEAYDAFWMRHFVISFGGIGISETFKHWINEGLMALFFLVISLEIKREIVRGELREWKAAALPIAAAIGGAIVPITIYLAINHGHAGAAGWGMPMTTDTAFSIGLLALLGRRIPLSLKLFLLTTMVVDDVGAIAAIAVFYNEGIQLVPLLVAGGILAVILVLHWVRLLRMSAFAILGVAMWLAIHASGVQASIAGVILGLAAPVVARRSKGAVAERLEASLIPVSTFVVIPLFALANAGVVFNWNVFTNSDAVRVGVGVAAGLVIGKTIGILAGSWVAVKMRFAHLPQGVHWGHITGVAMLAGVGFTLSIFIAELAFEDQPLISAAKISIFIASITSAVLGLAYIRFGTRPVNEAETVPATEQSNER